MVVVGGVGEDGTGKAPELSGSPPGSVAFQQLLLLSHCLQGSLAGAGGGEPQCAG